MRLAQVDLALLPIRRDPAVRAPDRNLRRHLPIALITPVDRELAGRAIGVVQRAIDLVVDIPRVDAVEHHATDGRRRTGDEIHKIDRMTSVVVERAAAFALGRTPGATLGSQHHGAIGLGADVVDTPQRARIDDARGFLEGTHEAVVITDLVHQAFGLGQRRQPLAVGWVEHEGLFAKDMKPLVQRLLDHRGVKLRRGCNDDGIERLAGEQPVVVVVALQPGVFRQDIGEVSRLITRGDHLHARVGVDDRVMRQPHLAQPDHSYSKHRSSPVRTRGPFSGPGLHF